MTKIYIAGASAEWERAQKRMAWARDNGLEVTYDWVADIIEHRIKGGKSDSDLTEADRLRLAGNDMMAVADCDIFWLLVPNKPVATVGGWVELGIALAGTAKVVVSGAYAKEHLFCSLADYQTSIDLTAMPWIMKQCGKVAP